MVLTRSQARNFYNRFGRKQDAQAFYEDAALEEMIVHAAFSQSESVFEFGCGTGRFALNLLERHLSSAATYLGSDLSQIMIDIARQRISPYARRAKVVLSDGNINFPLPAESVDRVISTYVLDLLSEEDILNVISESRRVLKPSGKLCLVSLTHGITVASRVVAAMWLAVFRLHAPLVGGCRPIGLGAYLDLHEWSIEYHKVVVRFGVPSEVLIASPKILLS